MNDKIMSFVKDLNDLSFLSNVNVPVLDGFKVVPNKGTLFTAVSDDNYIEQFMTDGVLDYGESFESHVEKVINDTKNFMKDASMSGVNESFIFLKDYTTLKYDFKIYIQDNILNEKIIRQFNIYFIDKNTRAFYEITFSSRAYSLSELDYLNNEITSSMLTTVNNMLDYIK